MPEDSLETQLDALAKASEAIASAEGSELAGLHTQLLGRKAGKLTHILRGLRDVDAAERRTVGQRANQIKQQLEKAFAAREAALAAPEHAVDQHDPLERRQRALATQSFASLLPPSATACVS